MKRLIIVFLAIGCCLSTLQAQRYAVLSIKGNVCAEATGSPRHELQLREVLTLASRLDIGYNSGVELLDEEAGKKYTLKTPGKGLLRDLLKDRQTSVLQLTAQYLAYTKQRLRGNGELTSRHYSDPATVTREVAVKHDAFEDEYLAFQRKAQREYEEFRLKAIRTYAEFMREAWKEFPAEAPRRLPKEDDRPPVVLEDDKPTRPDHSNEVVVEDTIGLASLRDEEQPVPVAPIFEQKDSIVEQVDFTFYGTPLYVRFSHKEDFHLQEVTEKAISELYGRLASLDFNNTIRDCLEIRIRYGLGDWAYLQLLDEVSRACFADANDATLFLAYLFQQSGYQMRLGLSDGRLSLLYSSEHTIFEQGYFIIDGSKYYVYKTDVDNLHVCPAAFPGEKPLSLCISQPMMLAEDMSEARTLTSRRYGDFSLQTSVNKNLLDFYNSYPTSILHNNQLTRWAIYADTPLEADLSRELLGTLRAQLSDLTPLEAVEHLLNWVQTAFEYGYDDEVWGHDRAFFAEETLYYPYSDCEDRAILFTRLVRDLLGLKTALVYYPGHLAAAVSFEGEDVAGDFFEAEGCRYTICDPTYIGAGVGLSMPDMDNKSAQIILLDDGC